MFSYLYTCTQEFLAASVAAQTGLSHAELKRWLMAVWLSHERIKKKGLQVLLRDACSTASQILGTTRLVISLTPLLCRSLTFARCTKQSWTRSWQQKTQISCELPTRYDELSQPAHPAAVVNLALLDAFVGVCWVGAG